MTKNTSYLVGILLLITVLVGLYFWLDSAKASEDEIEQEAKDITIVDKDILQEDVVKVIVDKQIQNGVPVQFNEYDNQILF